MRRPLALLATLSLIAADRRDMPIDAARADGLPGATSIEEGLSGENGVGQLHDLPIPIGGLA